jgi:hypothetical protein
MSGDQNVVWYWSRRGEQACAVSQQELYMIAELGYLRADDCLWRPGLADWNQQILFPVF